MYNNNSKSNLNTFLNVIRYNIVNRLQFYKITMIFSNLEVSILLQLYSSQRCFNYKCSTIFDL